MSILIKGMDMPKNCHECVFGKYEVCAINISVEKKDTITHSCPLVEVPAHGDLIDRDALKEAFCGNCFADEKPMECFEPCMDMRIILEAPTVIPAEEGET